MKTEKKAEDTFVAHLANNTYPGRGLVIGKIDSGQSFAIVYFIMGRSENSRNRRFAADGDRLWTEPVDESKVADPSLIIYDAMLALPNIQIVSNGDQTKTVFDRLKENGCFGRALSTREREPDAPNYTPRISALFDATGEEPKIKLSILKANRCNPDLTDRTIFAPALPPEGFGYGLTTYMGDGSPLPSFEGDPLLLPLMGDCEAILNTYWDALNKENRIALAVKQFAADGTLEKLLIKNRYE